MNSRTSLSSPRRAPRTRRIAILALALAAVPLTVSAGPDGRRLTLGANRTMVESAPAFVTPPNFLTPYDNLAASGTASARASEPSVSPATADAPPIRVVPAPDGAEAVTPDFKPAVTAPNAPARVTRVKHEPVRDEAPRTVKVTAPHTKVNVKTTPSTTRVRVAAPDTKVAVKDHKVRVDAPYTRVAVDDGRVRVRAPFVNLDIRW